MSSKKTNKKAPKNGFDRLFPPKIAIGSNPSKDQISKIMRRDTC